MHCGEVVSSPGVLLWMLGVVWKEMLLMDDYIKY